MGLSISYRGDVSIDFEWNEVTGAIGDSVTVLPLVVAVAILTDLSLSMMLMWFGVFQIVWGLYYGVPISVEPMKALAALILAGTVTTGEFLLAGVLLGAVLLGMGATGMLARVGQYIGTPVVRGIQFGVALVLLETGLRLGVANLQLAGLSVGIAILLMALGYWNLTAIVVLVVGGLIAGYQTGIPAPTVPTTDGLFPVRSGGQTLPVIEAAIAQLAMTVGNAALAASVLLQDYFDRDIAADDLLCSMGIMNLVAIPFGALPMCHGSGGVAGKYAFGARSAGANLLLGLLYALAALLAVDVVLAFPMAAVGVVLALIAVELGRSGLETDHLPTTLAVGVLGLVAGVGVAFVAGAVAYPVFRRVVDGE